MKKARIPCLILVAALLWAAPALAQDSHYATIQYGNRARLLGGAVVGSASDLSAVFYNPGRLVAGAEPELVLAGNVFEYTTISFKELDGPERKFSSSGFRLSPSLFAGELRFGWLGRSRLAYSFLTRQLSDFNTTVNLATTVNVFGLENPPTALTSKVNLDSRLSEYWVGITWATPLTERIGVGVSTFVATRNQRGRTQGTNQAVFPNGEGIGLTNREYRYNHWALLWKIGVGTQLELWDVGLAVTTPRVRLFGSGQLGFDESLVRTDGGESTILTGFAEDMPSTYNSPWAIAAGGSRDFGRTAVHLSLEWHDSVSEFTILDPQAELQFIGAPGDVALTHSLESVFNAAVGVQRQMSEHLIAFGSLRTDFSAAIANGTTNLSFSEWDLYHLAAGAQFDVGEAAFTLGAVYAFGNSTAPPQLEPRNIESKYKRLTFIVGFQLPFGDPPSPT